MGIFSDSVKTIRNSVKSVGKSGKKDRVGGKKTPGAGLLRNTKIKSGLK